MTDIFDMSIYRPIIEKIRISHNFSHQIISRDYLTLSGNDVFQNMEFGFRQKGLAASPDDFELRFDQSQVSVNQTFFSSLRSTTTENGLDTHDDFLGAKWFPDIIIGLELE